MIQDFGWHNVVYVRSAVRHNLKSNNKLHRSWHPSLRVTHEGAEGGVGVGDSIEDNKTQSVAQPTFQAKKKKKR